MTSTNFANLGAVGAKAAAGQVFGAGKAKVHEQEMASVFSSMMNQTPQNVPVAEKSGASPAESVSGTTAYDRYQYQDNHVEEAKPVSLSDKIAEGEAELEQFEQEVEKAVTEILDVDEEELAAVLEELGFTLYDLMDPQNLAQTVKQITGMEDDAQILLDGNFEQLRKDVGQIGGELFENLGLTPDQKEEFVTEMDVIKAAPTQEEMPEISEEIPVEAPVEGEAVTVETFAKQQEIAAASPKEAPIEPERILAGASKAEEALKPEPEAEGVQEKSEPEGEQPAVAVSFEEQAAKTEDGEFTPDERAREPQTHKGMVREREHVTRQPQAEHMTPQGEPQTVQADPIASAPSPNASYVSTHVMDIIRQVAENVRVVMSSESTSMEMQLNPENLGKIYLNVTSEEGVVSAHLRAQDEAVKAALETQLATLRENLNQAGIKVDAIEVSVATHEFERNLEQDGSGQKRRSAEEELPHRTARRNLNMNSLDELQGLMTEEEQLAARIMRDNGNSLDYKA